MDLIYADEIRKDIGVLPAYKLDMAYGKDENDFTVNLSRADHCCQNGYLIYAEGTDYGGVVDRIKSDTESDEITYGGRTWHGVLAKKVLCPDDGEDYLVLSGEANAVLQVIIDRIGLSGMYIASTDDTGVLIRNYRFERYCDAYTGIRKMLKAYGLKLRITWQINMVVLSAIQIRDYSQDEEFDTSQYSFAVQKNYRPVNHVVCLGQGDLRNRNVIHIFTDDHGGICQYLVDPSKDPVEDSDYILDTSQQVLFDQDEVAEVYDVSNAEVTTNYILLTSKPADWSANFAAYFQRSDEAGKFDPVKASSAGYSLQTSQPGDWSSRYASYYSYDSTSGSYSYVSGSVSYTALSSKPGDWDTGYGGYYYKSGGSYLQVQGVESSSYTRQTSQPGDWTENYGSYYSYDGSVYTAVQSESFYSYDLQTQEPADWDANYGSYYRRTTSMELDDGSAERYYAVTLDSKGRVPAWRSGMYYTRTLHQAAPAWGSADRYTRSDTVAAPAWDSATFYHQTGSAPAWSENTYYTDTGSPKAPTWKSGTYFRAAIDHYKVMVDGAIKLIEESHDTDELEINLEETDRVYDVGDIVGATDDITGQSVVQEVSKKIITIESDVINIRYEVD